VLEDVHDAQEARALLVAAVIRQQQGILPNRDELARIRRALQQHAPMSKPLHVPKPLVYYFRVGDRIKIGFTGNIESRIKDLAPEEVLGWEPGPASLEKARHRQFAKYRTAHEWFRDCPEIRQHIADCCYPHK